LKFERDFLVSTRREATTHSVLQRTIDAVIECDGGLVMKRFTRTPDSYCEYRKLWHSYLLHHIVLVLLITIVVMDSENAVPGDLYKA
jgi:hypothetical protein